MVDTKRTSSDLLTNIFQDGQADGAISANDVRDLIVSMLSPYGGGYMEGNATATTINTIDTFEDVAGTITANSALREVTCSAGGVLTYTGTPVRHFHVVTNLSMTAASNNQVIKFAWFKNGTTKLPAELHRKVGTGTDVGAASIHTDAMLSTGDTLQLKVTNGTSTASITVTHLYAFIMGMFV